MLQRILCLVFIFFTCNLYKAGAQSTDTLIQKADTLIKGLDSLKEAATDTGQKNSIDPVDYNATTSITLGAYFVLLWSDFKQEISGPFTIRSKKTWLQVGAFAAIEGALFLADKPIQRFALRARNDNLSLVNTSKYITNFGGLYEMYTLVGLGVYGFVFKNKKMQTTTLLASQAYITGAGMQAFLKLLSGRERPNYVPMNGSAQPSFKGPLANLGSASSGFPSGHTTVAFAAATVYAMEYRDKPLVPIIAYTAASLIGLSRITENKHWITDVFAGAALGYVTGRQVVNNYHRYAKLQRGKKKRGTIGFNLDYQQRMLLGNITYTFR